MLRYEDTEIEFVGARKESYHFESRNPVVENGSFRTIKIVDFTINALASLTVIMVIYWIHLTA
jgi:tRNA nucleotidyltransferase (CCA-adding enzyme)